MNLLRYHLLAILHPSTYPLKQIFLMSKAKCSKFLFAFLLTPIFIFSAAQDRFFRACLHGDMLEVFELYEKEGLSLLLAKDKDGNTPLHLACCSKKGGNKKEIIEFLLSKKVDVNVYNNAGSTPLTIAVSNDNYEATELLLKCKEIRVNLPYNQNHTPLHSAVIKRCLPIVKLLLSHPDTNPNFGTSEGATPLHFAAMMGLTEEAKLLIADPRTDLNATQYDAIYEGATPLHFAALQAQTEIVKALLESNRVDVHAAVTKGNHEGFTPLHFVVINPDTINVFEIVKLLIKVGANPKLKCKAGKTPLELTSVKVIQELLKNPNENYQLKKDI